MNQAVWEGHTEMLEMSLKCGPHSVQISWFHQGLIVLSHNESGTLMMLIGVQKRVLDRVRKIRKIIIVKKINIAQKNPKGLSPCNRPALSRAGLIAGAKSQKIQRDCRGTTEASRTT